MKDNGYQKKIARYYDEEAPYYWQRSGQNFILARLRDVFRCETERYAFTNALEVGCGPGLDLIYMAGKYPERHFTGIDLSPEMVRQARLNIAQAELPNAEVVKGDITRLLTELGGNSFDMIYVYFGALNTTENLYRAVRAMAQLSAPQGKLVLSMVNRHYLMDVLVKTLKGNFREATNRWTNQWRGYSPWRTLPSQLYTAGEIEKLFTPSFKLINRRGLSILYPPWYAHSKVQAIRWLLPALWSMDELLQKSPFWNLGEYSLYTFQKT